MPFKSVEDKELVNIKVIGVGGGGNNAIDNMIDYDVQGVEFISMNTDQQVLTSRSKAPTTILIGENTTHGRGAGANPEIGRKAAEEGRDKIAAAIKGAEMVFITAGMGGGTGTGAAPLIAQIAKENGVLTVGVVTSPFAFEGRAKIERAEKGIEELLKQVDTLVVIPNERIKLVSESKVTLLNAFKLADSVLKEAIQSITDLIQNHATVNLDFADVTTILKDAGYAHWCVQSAKGKDKAETVANAVITSPLLETSIDGATGVILNFNADPEVTLEDIERAAEIIRENAAPDANIIWGVNLDENLEDEIRVTVIATGYNKGGKTETLPSIKSDYTPKPVEKSSVKSSADEEKDDDTWGGILGGAKSASSDYSADYSDDDSDDFAKLLSDITKNK